jgi:hypothetical protein
LVYDLSNPDRGIRDYPRCRHTMQRLRTRLNTRTNEGYLLDTGDGKGGAIAYGLFGILGLVLNLLYRYTLHPLTSKLFGDIKTRRLERVLREHPESLICGYCNYLLKRIE